MRRAANVAIVRKGRLLILRKKESWILPGGKPEENEPDSICLFREMNEEIPTFRFPVLFDFYGRFSGITPHKGDELEARVYINVSESDFEKVNSSAEISDAYWLARGEVLKYNLSDITRKIVSKLAEDGILR